MTVSVDQAPAEAPAPEHAAHQPYVPAHESPPEMTFRAVFSGAVLGIVFAASSVYLALKVGLTVSASIPVTGVTNRHLTAIRKMIPAPGEALAATDEPSAAEQMLP